MSITEKRFFLYKLSIDYATGRKTRAQALDLITDKREENGTSPNIKEAGELFDKVREIAESKDTTKGKLSKIWGLAVEFCQKI